MIYCLMLKDNCVCVWESAFARDSNLCKLLILCNKNLLLSYNTKTLQKIYKTKNVMFAIRKPQLKMKRKLMIKNML